MQRLVIISLFGLSILVAGPDGFAANDPFDPGAYLAGKQAEKAKVDAAEQATKAALKTHGIYRINGQRFHKFASELGAVYLPGAGSLPDFTETLDAFVLCEEHLRLLTEVLPVRQNLPVEPDVKPLAPKIIEQIQRCLDGRVKGPVLTVKQPDGALVEITAPDSASGVKKAAAKSDPHQGRDDAFDERESATSIGVDLNK